MKKEARRVNLPAIVSINESVASIIFLFTLCFPADVMKRKRYSGVDGI